MCSFFRLQLPHCSYRCTCSMAMPELIRDSMTSTGHQRWSITRAIRPSICVRLRGRLPSWREMRPQPSCAPSIISIRPTSSRRSRCVPNWVANFSTRLYSDWARNRAPPTIDRSIDRLIFYKSVEFFFIKVFSSICFLFKKFVYFYVFSLCNNSSSIVPIYIHVRFESVLHTHVCVCVCVCLAFVSKNLYKAINS